MTLAAPMGGQVEDREFADWYASAAPRVTQQVAGAVGDALLAREATAEAFARAYERWGRVHRMELPEAWVRTVAINVCRRGWRQRALEARAIARLAPALVGEEPTYHDDVYRAVRALPTRMRQAIRLRYWDDLTEREVAERMGVAPGTVAALLSTARTRLRAAVGADSRQEGRAS